VPGGGIMLGQLSLQDATRIVHECLRRLTSVTRKCEEVADELRWSGFRCTG
jgi:hypothetical protein